MASQRLNIDGFWYPFCNTNIKKYFIIRKDTMPAANFLQNRLIDRTSKILSRVLDFRTANQRVISTNLANADTPGFKPKELRFDEELRRASEKDNIQLRTTNQGHLSQYSNVSGGEFPVVEKVAEGPGSDELNIDAEMAKMMQNNLLYETSARLLSNKLKALQTAIESGRR